MKISKRTSPYHAAGWAYREAIQQVEDWLGGLFRRLGDFTRIFGSFVCLFYFGGRWASI